MKMLLFSVQTLSMVSAHRYSVIPDSEGAYLTNGVTAGGTFSPGVWNETERNEFKMTRFEKNYEIPNSERCLTSYTIRSLLYQKLGNDLFYNMLDSCPTINTMLTVDESTEVPMVNEANNIAQLSIICNETEISKTQVELIEDSIAAIDFTHWQTGALVQYKEEIAPYSESGNELTLSLPTRRVVLTRGGNEETTKEICITSNKFRAFATNDDGTRPATAEEAEYLNSSLSIFVFNGWRAEAF